jgi:DNA-binding response OmpR family regulator
MAIASQIIVSTEEFWIMKESMKNNTILIIENDLNVARQIVTQCFKLGYEPLVARDGFTGMLLAKVVRPRMILSDVTVPGLDGFQIVRRVRELHELDETTVVAISSTFPGQSGNDDVSFDDCLLKPINSTRLEHVIAQGCEQARVALSA